MLTCAPPAPLHKPQFYDLRHFCIGQIHKGGSSTLARAGMETDYPDIVARHPPQADGMHYRALAPLTENPTKPVLLAVRAPVERFRSAVAMLRIDVDAAIAALGITLDPHFAKQVSYTKSGMPTTVYRFPDGLKAFCAHAGFPYPLPVVNRGRLEKPILTDAQIIEIKTFYKDDEELHAASII